MSGIHIALDQEDTQLRAKKMGKAVWDALSAKGGFDYHIGLL